MTYQKLKDWTIECVAKHHKEVTNYLIENTTLDVYEDEEGEHTELYNYERCIECIAQILADEYYPKVQELSENKYEVLISLLYDEIEDVFPYNEIKQIALISYEIASESCQAKLSAMNGTW